MQLDFLETIEGTSGEELTSAVLKYLIVNSATFRDCLIERISRKVPVGYAPSFRNGLYCRTEYPTEDQQLGNGFIDILLADGEPKEISFVAALEVKLWAAFTPDQPAKYLNTLKRLVVNADVSRLAIIVLAPDERKDDVEKHLKEQETKLLLTPGCLWNWQWSDIRNDLMRVTQEESTSISLVAKWLLRFLKVRLGETTLQGTPDAYVGRSVEIGNVYHYDFLYKLKSCLPSPGRIIAKKGQDQYLGLSCECVVPERPGQPVAKVWIGFVPRPSDRCIVFGIDTGLSFRGQPNTFPHWDREFREIPFDAELKTALQWQRRITKELIEIQKLRFPSATVDVAKS